MGYRYCVFGAGRQGVAAIYDLAMNCDADYIVVYEPSLVATLAAQDRLIKLLGDKYLMIDWLVELKEVDWLDWTSFDVMLSCAPWRHNVSLAEFAVRRNIPFCDLGGNPDTVTMQEQIESESSIVPDCGLSPGISNILAASLARRGCDEIRVRCGGIPIRKITEKGLNYRLTFDPMGLISEYSGKVPIIVEGLLKTVPALSWISPYEDDYECSYTSNNSMQVVKHLHDIGVKNYDYMTIRYPGHWDLVRGWKRAGFLQGNVTADNSLANVLRNNDDLTYNRDINDDKVILSIVGYRGDGMREIDGWDLVVFPDKTTKFSAMELMTSWGITMVAHYMAENPDSLPGTHGTPVFATPDRFVDADWIIDGLRERGVK